MKNLVLFIVLISAISPNSFSKSIPAGGLDKVATCVETTISKIEHRLENVKDSGSLVLFENGIMQVSYKELSNVNTSKVGDKVIVCLAQKQSCAPDPAAFLYTTTNLRTLESWTMSGSSHECGGT